MKLINEYMQLTQTERQQHLNLSESCIERGGRSELFKGLLADFLGTEIPAGKHIHLCHACNNGKCSNPKHLYWGTPKENVGDMHNYYGVKSPWDRSVAKYGESEARKRQAR